MGRKASAAYEKILEKKENAMAKYVVKRILLMLFTLFVITTICFMLIRMLPRELPQDKVLQEVIQARWDALGYNKPLLVQYGIYLKNIFTAWDFGTSWYIEQLKPAWDVLVERLLPTSTSTYIRWSFPFPSVLGSEFWPRSKRTGGRIM